MDKGVTRWGFCVLVVAGLLGASCSGSSDSTQPTSLPETTAPSATSALPSTTAPPQTTPDPTTTPSVTAPPVTATTVQTTAPPTTATTLPPPLLDNIAVATGAYHACSLHTDGTVSCWGRNYLGQLGNGSNEEPLEVVKVVGIRDAIAIDSYWDHTCAVHETGRVSCWGENDYGQLGNGTRSASNRPVTVDGIDDALEIAIGWPFSCALHTDGTVSCWGLGRFGALGNGTIGQENFASTPVKVASISDAIAITTGASHACALRENGTILCWGSNRTGKLGDGTMVDSSLPVEVKGISDAIAISAAGDYTCALHADRSVSCWGTDVMGNLATDEIILSSIPNRLKDISEVRNMASATSYLCLFKQNSREIVCLGADHYGNLGSRSEKPSVHKLRSDKEIIFLGLHFFQICAVYADTTIYCWGPEYEDKNYVFKDFSNRYIVAPG